MLYILAATIITLYVLTGYRYLTVRSSMRNTQQEKAKTTLMDLALVAGLALFSLAVSSLNYWEGKLNYFNTTPDLVDPADITTAAINAHLMLFVLAILFPVTLGMINVMVSRVKSPETIVDETVPSTVEENLVTV